MSDDVWHSSIWGLVVGVSLLAVAATIMRGCESAAERDRAVGVACVEQGGSWVRSGDTFQCISTTSPDKSGGAAP